MKKEQANKEELEKSRKKLIFYQDDTYRESYDLFMTVVLLISCILSPYTIAFYAEESFNMRIISAVIDVLFFLDMIVIFNTAIYDDDM